LHFPIAINVKAEFTTTVITAQNGGWTQTVVLGKQFKMDAHHTPSERPSRFDL
jgi:hypothetical protein